MNKQTIKQTNERNKQTNHQTDERTNKQTNKQNQIKTKHKHAPTSSTSSLGILTVFIVCPRPQSPGNDVPSLHSPSGSSRSSRNSFESHCSFISPSTFIYSRADGNNTDERNITGRNVYFPQTQFQPPQTQ